MAVDLQRIAASSPETARQRALNLVDGVIFEDAPDFEKFASVLFAYQGAIETDANRRPSYIRSVRLPGQRLFWLARDGRSLVELAADDL